MGNLNTNVQTPCCDYAIVWTLGSLLVCFLLFLIFYRISFRSEISAWYTWIKDHPDLYKEYEKFDEQHAIYITTVLSCNHLRRQIAKLIRDQANLIEENKDHSTIDALLKEKRKKLYELNRQWEKLSTQGYDREYNPYSLMFDQYFYEEGGRYRFKWMYELHLKRKARKTLRYINKKDKQKGDMEK